MSDNNKTVFEVSFDECEDGSLQLISQLECVMSRAVNMYDDVHIESALAWMTTRYYEYFRSIKK